MVIDRFPDFQLSTFKYGCLDDPQKAAFTTIGSQIHNHIPLFSLLNFFV